MPTGECNLERANVANVYSVSAWVRERGHLTTVHWLWCVCVSHLRRQLKANNSWAAKSRRLWIIMWVLWRSHCDYRMWSWSSSQRIQRHLKIRLFLCEIRLHLSHSFFWLWKKWEKRQNRKQTFKQVEWKTSIDLRKCLFVILPS